MARGIFLDPGQGTIYSARGSKMAFKALDVTQRKGKANRKPKEQRDGFHGVRPALAHLNVSGGKESRFVSRRTLDGERQRGSRESISTPGDGRTLRNAR